MKKTTPMLIKRNIKLYFNDKAMFFTSLITPAILLVLYATFLKNVFDSSYRSAFEEMHLSFSDKLINGLVAGQIISSLLAVSCVTVAFCANFVMVQDKTTGTIKDLRISPVKPASLAVSYYVATLTVTIIICLSAMVLGLVYTYSVGWYMSAADIALLALDVILLSLFGTALSSVIFFFLSTQGQISAVGTIVSAGYGFICGAYMPISQFSKGLQNILAFFPGTYGTSLVRTHALRGVLSQLESDGAPASFVEQFRDLSDSNIYFFGDKVSTPVVYSVVCGTIAALVVIYVILNMTKKRNKS